MSEFGLADAMVQREKMTHSIASSLFWLNCSLGLLLGLVVVALAKPAIIFYDEPRVGAVFVVLSLMVLSSSLAAQYTAILRRQMRIFSIEIATLCASLVSIAITIVFAWCGGGYWAVVLYTVLGPALIFLFLSISSGWVPSAPWKVSFIEAKESLVFGGFLASSRLIFQISRNMGMVIVGSAFSNVLTGLYYRSWTLANLPQTRVIGSLAGAYIPSMSRLQKDPDEFRETFVRMINRMNLIAVPVGIAICGAGDLLVRIILGPDWVEAGPLLSWFGILAVQAGITNGFQWALISSGQVKPLFFHRLFAATTIICALLVGSQYGLTEMVALYMLVIVFLNIPVLVSIAVRYTAVSAYNLVQVFLVDTVYGAVVYGCVVLVRQNLPDMATFYEAVIVGTVIGLAYSIRILLNKELREFLTKKFLR